MSEPGTREVHVSKTSLTTSHREEKMSERQQLQEALCCYIADTLSYIDSVRGFCEKSSEWQAYRPGKELAVVLKDTLRGLEELHCFLDAVEKLAVTSHNVFMENQVLYLTDGIKFEHVQIIIVAARMICPLLLKFKRDAQVFFLPKLQNVEVLSNQLDIYIKTTQIICQELAKSFFGDFCLGTTVETQVDLDVDVSEDDIQKMLYHINELSKVRMNQPFWTVFLFQEESCSDFINEFEERQPRMLQCLKELEECAVQLDRMNKGSKISSVAGSSVGAVGSILSIIGLALIPVTARVSLGLTIAGTALGITSGVNSVVTKATGLGVNFTQQNKASEVFKVFMEDVQVLQAHLREEIVGVQRSVEEIPDIGQTAAEGSLALSKWMRVGLIAANVGFLGIGIICICKDSISLAKGSETKISQFIRARSALWSSEMDSWQKIHDSLSEGLQTSKRNRDLLETPFYPEKMETSHQEEDMSERSERQQLQEALCCYIADTLSYIDSVRGFCEKSSEWVSRREKERKMMTYIKNRADSVDQTEDEVQAFEEYMKSKEPELDADSRPTDPGKELAVVLMDTLRGLEELHCFLDAVEKLAVTSHNVFMENQVLYLTDGISLQHAQIVISFARMICPLLLKFKRDAQVFFLPKLQNVEVLSYQLDIYIKTTQIICQELAKSFFGDFCLKTTVETQVDLNVDVSEDDIQRMLYHINELSKVRMNQPFRTVFMFQEESCSPFIGEFKERQPRMVEFLKELEECAVQLDRMNLGSKISSVAGSSVGAVGSILSIIGLALIPVTAGVSLGLTIAGAGMGIASGVNGVVTTATEIGVNATQQKKANELLKVFKEDMQVLQTRLEEAINQSVSKMGSDSIDVLVGLGKVISKAGVIGKGIDSIVDAASAAKSLGGEVIAGVGNVVVQEGKILGNVPKAAADIPDIGQAAAKGSLALSKSARAGFIAVNALFLGMDIFFICKDSISLAKGSETEVSQFIRARSALWSSEMDSWQKIHDSLSEGLQTSKRNEALLEAPFYPEDEDDTEADEVDGELTETERCVIQ
ncbi:hypothetical protein INR49_030420 [Caranx melampygus]|nr:hypothetical protein INR49_030420 [Caranx melampygus]